MSKVNQKMIGESLAFLDVLDQVSQAAPLNRPVLIVGERGTGKELIANRLHYLSQRWEASYEQINCAALNENLIESELFGHEAGAFTGASKAHIGRFERVNHGTLFLDELATTSARTQEKLLRVIEYGEFERLGGSKTIKADVRIIAATNVDLPQLARSGGFRADLLDRLAFDVITLPPLRERKEDIILLAESFAINMSQDLGREFFAGFSPAVITELLEYSWPGNIRELKNCIERSVCKNKEFDEALENIVLDPFDSPYRLSNGIERAESSSPLVEKVESGKKTAPLAFPLDLKGAVKDFEQSMIDQALELSQFNQKKAADKLGLTYHQLRAYLRKFKD